MSDLLEAARIRQLVEELPGRLRQRTDRLLCIQHAIAISIARGFESGLLSDLVGNYALARLYWKEIERRSVERGGLWVH